MTDAYVAGFSKVVEAYGVDPKALAHGQVKLAYRLTFAIHK